MTERKGCESKQQAENQSEVLRAVRNKGSSRMLANFLDRNPSNSFKLFLARSTTQFRTHV